MLPDPAKALRLGSVNLSGPMPVTRDCGMLGGGKDGSPIAPSDII